MTPGAHLYEAIVVDGNPDPALPGHIRVRIPQLYLDNVCPVLVPPLVSGWQTIPSAINPEDSTKPIRVCVFHLGGTAFRWFGTSEVWDEISNNPGTRSGARSHDHRHFITLDNGDGATISVNGVGVITIKPNGDIDIETGQASVSMRSGGALDVKGVNVKVEGATIGLNSGIDGYMKSIQLLTDLSLVLAEVVAVGAASLPAPVPTLNASAMIVKIQASLAAGLPYLSTTVKGG